MKLLVVFEQTTSGYSAYAPDLPGCIATGSSRPEVEQAMREAVDFHIDGLRDVGEPVPEAHTYAAEFDVSA